MDLGEGSQQGWRRVGERIKKGWRTVGELEKVEGGEYVGSMSVITTSISGLLCLSTFWLEKFSRHMAASRVLFTQIR